MLVSEELDLAVKTLMQRGDTNPAQNVALYNLIRKVRKKIEQLEADKRRLDWLEKNHLNYTDEAIEEKYKMRDKDFNLREAIDAAMERGKL
jgi:hypothetical protein